MGKDFYRTLGISHYATEEDIKRSYRKLALTYHPDKNKSPQAEEHFRRIREAYEVLSNSKRRSIYDQFGEEGLKGAVPSSPSKKRRAPFAPDEHVYNSANPFGIFGSTKPNRHFGQQEVFRDRDGAVYYRCHMERGGGAKGEAPQHSHHYSSDLQPCSGSLQHTAVQHDLYVSLEDIFNGCKKTVKISRMIVRHGRAYREEKVFCITVKPGWKAGTKITFEKEGDRTPGMLPADIVYIIRDMPHPFFKREGNDVRYMVSITLEEALCGTEVEVPTLCGDKITLSTEGEVIKPNTEKRITGMGLPISKNPTQRGDMIIAFKIEFPDGILPEAREQLSNILLTKTVLNDNVVEIKM